MSNSVANVASVVVIAAISAPNAAISVENEAVFVENAADIWYFFRIRLVQKTPKIGKIWTLTRRCQIPKNNVFVMWSWLKKILKLSKFCFSLYIYQK